MKELFQTVLSCLLDNGITLASAESCTGGYFAKTVTDYPGISAIFDRGIVTYSDRAKIEELGVREETIAKYSAVSRETAEEMACGLFRKTGCDVCVSVTGYAGPVSARYPEEPVGLFYIGLCLRGTCKVKEFRAGALTREAIRKTALTEMFRMIFETVVK